MAWTDGIDIDAITDSLVQRYAGASSETLGETAKHFLRGIWSFPDDIGMAFAVSVSATGVLGPHLQRNAREVLLQFESIVCLVSTSNGATLYHIAQMYFDYLKTSGRWKAEAAQVSGRALGSALTYWALARVRRQIGTDPKSVPKLGKGEAAKRVAGKAAVRVSLFAFATYGAACRAIIAGDRTFIGILHTMVAGEVDRQIGNLDLHFEYNAPWRQLMPRDADGQVSELRDLLQQLCQLNKSYRS